MDKKKCCGVYMVCDGGSAFFIDGDTTSWICLICGNYQQETQGILDKEELDNYRENYSEEYDKILKEDRVIKPITPLLEWCKDGLERPASV